MQAFDRRLLRYARATRGYLTSMVAIGITQASLILAQAYVLATVLVLAFEQQRDLTALAVPLVILLLTICARALLAWAAEVAAHRTSTAVKQELRQHLLHHVVRLGPRWLAGERSGELASLTTRGIDALDSYFSRYLPQLVLAGLIPVAVIAMLAGTDRASALVVIVTVPLIPAFMVLVGVATRRRVNRQWDALQALAHHFLDILSGLGTLKAFGRSRAQSTIIARLADQQRRASLSTMRVAFLTSLALELTAALSFVVVAVAIAVRVAGGELDLRTALFVLLLVPEAYWPLRQGAAHYHASAEGLSAAADMFSVLEQPVPGPSLTADRPRAGHYHQPVPDPRTAAIRLDDVTVLGSDRAHPPLEDLSVELAPGQVTGLVAPSGAGKSTVLALLLGFVRPDHGRVLVDDIDLATLDADAWRSRIGWLPQDPVLFAGTVADNIALRDPHADADAIARAARSAAVDVSMTLEIGERGLGLSAGQRRRVALARALLRDAPLLLLDEPTEGVDPETETALLQALPAVLTGRTVILVTHRPGLLRLCHHVVRLDRLGVPA
ncbi:thiol reductant ABC exporter subunit CydD [Actinopolymorpha sp. B17G11]|uniref:thiol reductant ABC exporter subunit CydD n=1 Tax=unclassified Actinopolymorpha TaxID=2627063 RepID=UPI0032D8BC2A